MIQMHLMVTSCPSQMVTNQKLQGLLLSMEHRILLLIRQERIQQPMEVHCQMLKTVCTLCSYFTYADQNKLETSWFLALLYLCGSKPYALFVVTLLMRSNVCCISRKSTFKCCTSFVVVVDCV